jgi:hypothetical protein
MMKIGIIGTGVVGLNLAKGWAKAGHHLMLSSREPQSAKMQAQVQEVGGTAQAGTVEQTIQFGEVVVLAMGWSYLPATLQAIDAALWSGKTVIDATNRFGAGSAVQELAQLLPTAHLVKAFNTIGAEHMATGHLNGEQLTMFLAGDHPQANATVAQLIRDNGFEPVEVGGLTQAPLIETLAQLWVTLARGSAGRAIGFRLVKG